MSAEKSILFICGSMNQTTQMLQISRHLTEYRQAFTPFYCEGVQEAMRRLKLLEFTIIGAKLVARCHRYLRASGLAIDYQGRRGPYDLVVTCSDVFVQKNIRGQKVVLVQEGITDPETAAFRLVQRHRSLPRWLAGTAATGLSDVYRAFCVASEGYRDLFIGKGAKAEKIVVTGIPNFDHCEHYLDNTFPHRHYVLVCTSPLREIFRGEDRPSFIRNAVAIANGRPMIFKFHPSEDLVRAEREVRQYAPGALTFSDGSAEEMIANCDVLITRYSSTAFVGLALGKETHSDFPADELRRLLPVQNNAAAANIADVCRRVIDDNRYPVRRAITVRAVTSWRDRRSFQQLPWTIYANDPNWVPPILSQERGLLGWERHPFFDHAEMVTLLAERGGEAVGRIAVFVNDVHNAKYDEKRGFFGFFECVDDVAVARELFDAGRAWLRQRGMTAWRGPVNLSLNYTCGLLIDGFGSPPVFLMTYNPRYYAALIEACGFAKTQDLYAYEMDVPLLAKLVDRYKPAVMSALDGDDLVVRRFDRSHLAAEIATFLEVYNRALEGTWGFTPLQEREAKHIAAEMGHIIAPEFAAFALVDGKVVGAVLALLDYNQIIRKLDGRLLPFGILRLMRGRKRINVARAMAMTMVPGYQQSGISIVLLDRLVEAAKPWGLKGWEFSWVLESNDSSRGTLRRLGTKLAKTYRIYDQAL